ncbi:MAG TPA: ATP-binding protein [Candidatus Obscuribacterales bacterium]
MSGQRLQLSLFQKALILVAVPLVFELVLLGTLNWLLNESEREAQEAEKASTVIRLTDSLIQGLNELGYAIVAYDAAPMTVQPDLERNLANGLRSVPEKLRELELKVQDEPKHKETIDEVSRKLRPALSWIVEAKQRADAGAKLNVAEALKMKDNHAEIVKELDSIIADKKAAQEEKPETAARLKTMVKGVIVLGIAMSILIALVLVSIFQKGTARRLKVLMENSVRLGAGKELTAPLAGYDEIAQIDRVFHAAANAITEAQRKERAAIDNAVDVICSIDKSGKFVSVSPASEKLWGYAPDDLIGRDWLDVIFKDDVARSHTWAENMHSGSAASETIENRVSRKDGTLVDMRWSAHWSEAEGSLFCVAHDMTERLEVERFKQQFAAMISHDLRTPLSAVQSTLELLGAGVFGALTEKAQQKVTRAEDNLRHSINLINNLLDLEKIESGRMELRLQPAQLDPLFKRCAAAVAPLAESKSIQIVLPENDATVRADEGRLTQVVINLLGNAIKFSPQDSQIKIALDSDNSSVRVKVIDQGPGIPASQKELIFERYHQVSSQSARQGEGTGLGLAICKAIIEAHGGKIGVESEEGKGSVFWFSLKACASREAETGEVSGSQVT